MHYSGAELVPAL